MKKIIRIKYQKININRKWIIFGILFWIISFFIEVWPIVFLSLFCIGNAIVLSLDRYVSMPIDVELSTFASILMTKAFGLQWGIATAIITKLAAIIHNKKFTMDHLFMVGGYCIAAFMASILPGSLFMVGLFATLVTNIYIVFVSKFITMLSNYEIFMYGSSNVLFNVVLFIGFSDIFYKIMMFLA
jgi:hypothetical protein